MFASRWHSPPKPGSVLSCVDRHVQRRRAGRRRGCPARRPRARPTRTPSSSPAATRSSSVVLPAPGRAHQVDHRHAGAVEVVAVGARDRVVGVERVLDDPDLRPVHRAPRLHRADLEVPPDLRKLPGAPRPRSAATAARSARARACCMTSPPSTLSSDVRSDQRAATPRAATASSSAARTGAESSPTSSSSSPRHHASRLAADDERARRQPARARGRARAPSPGPCRARRARPASVVELGLDHVERSRRARRAAMASRSTTAS